MWYKSIGRTEFLLRLYDEVPKLEAIDIYEIKIHDSGDRVLIRFKLNYTVDNPPSKWTISKYEVPIINLELFGVTSLELLSEANVTKTDIVIANRNKEGIVVTGVGKFMFNIFAEAGLIQSIDGTIL